MVLLGGGREFPGDEFAGEVFVESPVAAGVGAQELLLGGINEGIAGGDEGDGDEAVFAGAMEGEFVVGAKEAGEDLSAVVGELAEFDDRVKGEAEGGGGGPFVIDFA